MVRQRRAARRAPRRDGFLFVLFAAPGWLRRSTETNLSGPCACANSSRRSGRSHVALSGRIGREQCGSNRQLDDALDPGCFGGFDGGDFEVVLLRVVTTRQKEGVCASQGSGQAARRLEIGVPHRRSSRAVRCRLDGVAGQRDIADAARGQLAGDEAADASGHACDGQVRLSADDVGPPASADRSFELRRAPPGRGSARLAPRPSCGVPPLRRA